MIESARNPRVVRAAQLQRSRHRRESGRTLLEGPHLVNAGLSAGVIPETLFTLEVDELAESVAAAGGEVLQVGRAPLEHVAETERPRGPVAVVAIPDEPTLTAADSIVLCEVRDPGNAGALIRSAAAFGFQVAASAGSVDLWAPKVLRAAAGAHFATSIVTDSDLATIVATGMSLVVLEATGGLPASVELNRPVGLLVGNEAHGVSPQIRDLADQTLRIPMNADVESLNAAVAGSIAMYLIAARRR